jgi:DNA repair protein RecO (recombination protein O)
VVVTTDAIVLRTMKFRDTSLIVTLYTRELGRLSVLAKGARERAAKGGGVPDVMSRLSAVVYWHEHRDLHLLSRWEVLRRNRRITESMDRLSVGMSAVELLDAVSYHEENRGVMFELLEDVLEEADTASRNILSLTPYFQMQVLAALGFRPGIDQCRRCHTDLTVSSPQDPFGVLLEPGGGTIVCAACEPHPRPEGNLSMGALRTLQRLLRASGAHEATALAMVPRVRHEVGSSLNTLLRHHAEGMRPLKTGAVFASLG